MKCNYCQRPYKDIYIQEDEVIPVCRQHLNDHIESYNIGHDPFANIKPVD